MRQGLTRGRGSAARSVVLARRGMACAAQPLASLAGVDILRAGGSAVDAAIAVNACLAVTEPTSCGLGGDLFALLWEADGARVFGLDASGRAPLAASIAEVERSADGTVPLRSPASWTVPGCVEGWAALHDRFGRLPMARVLAPAIDLARDGFPVSPVIAGEWARASAVLRAMPGFADVFMPGDRPPAEGEIFRNAALARTLEAVAASPRDAFRDLIAPAIVAFSSAHGGRLAREDFEAHASREVVPIATTYRGVDVLELPPPGQGLAALQLLNVVDELNVAAHGRDAPDYWHLFVEAKKQVYGDRARLYGDPDFARVPVQELLSREHARRLAGRVDSRRAALVDLPGDPPALSRRETTLCCTADASGSMVALIQSNYTGFGSGHVVTELGFGLQNRGALFALDPAHPNALAPGKRPFHTIIPALLMADGEPLAAFGLMGGDMQPQGHAQVVVNLVDHAMNLQEAGDAPRFHHGGSSEPTGTRMREGGVLHLEDGVSPAIQSDLASRGHALARALPGTFGGYQAVARDRASGGWCGATESRKDGCALGY